MNKYKIFTLLGVFLLSNLILLSQQPKRDSANFINYKNEFWEEIKKSNEDFHKAQDKKDTKLTFRMDYSAYNLPKSLDDFKKYWHNDPISQGSSGTCWDFSGTSYFESEIYRITKKKVKMSEMFTAYWEYIEKARRFVREHGNSAFAEGSQCNAVTRIWKQYGCVPESVYNGMKEGQKFPDHEKLISDMDNYLSFIKKNNFWNEEVVIQTIKSTLNYYLGEPPTDFTVDGKKYTPKEYLEQYIKLNLDDYVDIMSLKEKPFWAQAEYEVTDNWWKFSDYYNVPLEDYMKAIKTAVKSGFTIAIGGDVSETGFDSHAGVAMIPSYDIPSEYIDDNARQMRFSNGATTDDHGIHLVGYKEDNGKFWFLIKDSGSGSRNNSHPGYYFYSEDYVKLKMINFTVHKSAVEDLLKKFKK